MENNPFTPTEFVAVANQTLEYAYSGVTIVGEVASFKVNQGKWVFFDLKDDETCVPCFMTLWSMRQPLEDGMKVVIRGVPKLTKWGKFSVTVSQVAPVGEGSLKKAYEMLKKKLTDEGLFDPAKKRAIPSYLNKIGVISSLQAAGYADFIKIINARWGGMKVITAHTQVQGLDAPDQIIRALDYFNERSEVQVIVILRGGGSKDDLSCFNDEKLVRAVASSKIPVVTGIGHEIDESLVDLAADLAASTPSNAAELLTPDRKQEIMKVRQKTLQIGEMLTMQIDRKITDVQKNITDVFSNIKRELEVKENDLRQRMRLLEALNPEVVLKQGYAILSGKVSPGSVVKITTYDLEITTLVQEIIKRSKNG